MMRLRGTLALLMALAACDATPVEWNDPVPAAQSGTGGQLTIDAAGQPRYALEPVASKTVPGDPRLCHSSLRLARASAHLYAVWWSVRRDSGAVLYSAQSSDSGATWGTPVAVDTSDVSSAGCSRPTPSVATVGDDLHVAYSMVAPEGTGVFFAHFMGSMLHSPVAVIYGERLVATAIAAEGDRVLVAYEEPNGTRKQVDVALSTTQGHLFDWHTTASRDIDAATSPAVALAGNTIAVSWMTQRATDTTATRIVRVGHIR